MNALTQGIKGQLVDRRLASVASREYPDSTQISKGSADAHNSPMAEFFKAGKGQGHPLSISRDGLGTNYVNYGVPTAESRKAIEEIIAEMKTNGTIAFREGENGSIEFLGQDYEAQGEAKEPFNNNTSSGAAEEYPANKAEKVALSADQEIARTNAMIEQEVPNMGEMSLQAWEQHISAKKRKETHGY